MKTYFVKENPKPVSQVALGTMIIGLKNYSLSAELLDCAAEHGINALDTAHAYGGGDSERAIGAWMQERGNRDKMFIITKGAHPNADRKRVTPHDITTDLTDSLARLKTDYIDLYFLHRDDETKEVGPIIDVLNEHRAAGRIQAFGGSNWTHERIEEANKYAFAKKYAPMTASSPNYGLCEQVEDPWGPGCVTISGSARESARKFYKQNDIPVFAYSSLGRGLLSGKATRENYRDILDGAAIKAYAHEVNFEKLDRAHILAMKKNATVAQIAIAYITCQKFSVLPIIGAASKQEISEIVAATDISLTEKELVWLDKGDA